MFIDDRNKRDSIEKMRKFLVVNNNEVIKCEKCGGTGLKLIIKKSDLSFWNGEYCEFCNGIGYVNDRSIKKETVLQKIINFFRGKLKK